MKTSKPTIQHLPGPGRKEIVFALNRTCAELEIREAYLPSLLHHLQSKKTPAFVSFGDLANKFDSRRPLVSQNHDLTDHDVEPARITFASVSLHLHANNIPTTSTWSSKLEDVPQEHLTEEESDSLALCRHPF